MDELAGEGMLEPYDMSWPPEMDCFWAKKKNRMYLEVVPEVLRRIGEMYNQGKGFTNKNLRYTAEQAHAELKDGILRFLWDMRHVCSVTKIKGLFGRKYQEEQRADTANIHEDPIVKAHTLVEDNRIAEDKMIAEIKRGEKKIENVGLSIIAKVQA
jgi:hypothetical protein